MPWGKYNHPDLQLLLIALNSHTNQPLSKVRKAFEAGQCTRSYLRRKVKVPPDKSFRKLRDILTGLKFLTGRKVCRYRGGFHSVK